MQKWQGLALAALAAACAPPAQGADGPLAPPLACTAEQACFIQNYPDLDPSTGAADPSCGGLTYDGHDGVDVRVRAAAARAGVPVLSPLSGVVRGVRDGEPDGAFRQGGRAAVEGRECGNGVAVVGDDGLEAQLCHLRQGSVRVRAGERVVAGQPLGLVGQSGMAAFPHVHVSVRRDGVGLDPGSGLALAAGSCVAGAPGVGAGAMWSAAAQRTLPFTVRSAIVDWGFLDAPPEPAQVADLAPAASGTRTAAALVFYATFAGPLAGDVQRLRVLAPNGETVAVLEETQPRDQAQMVRFVGRRTPGGGWPAGVYTADISFSRAGVVIASQRATLTVQ